MVLGKHKVTGSGVTRRRPKPRPSCVSPAAVDPCASGPCLHGGSCSSTQDLESYHCTCPMAFTGKDCGTGEQSGSRPGPGGALQGPVVCWAQGTHCVVPREML